MAPVDRGKLIADGEVVFGEYKRFEFTDDGVSPRVIPGRPRRHAPRGRVPNTTTPA